jgi:tRNA (guanine-N7-)-methyltransferase
MNSKMNFFNGQTFKNYFSSRNRSLTKDQQLILELYQEKISIESFFELEKLNDFNFKSLEIGFGTGEKLLESAINYPDKLFIGIEYYKKGIAQLLLNNEKYKLKNIRLFYGDAFDYLKLLKANFLDEVLIMFPDPWPKKRHWKRRIINNASVSEISRSLKSNGRVLFYTDDKGIAFWGLRHFIFNNNFIWAIDKPLDCKNRNSSNYVTKYEHKALENNIQPYYFNFVKK